MITDDPIIAKRIADLVRKLSSPSDGEIIATVRALQRTLEANRLDIHAIAGPLEAPNGKSIPEEKMQRVWDAAYARGVQDTENRQHGSDDFLGTDGKPTWKAVALFVIWKHRANIQRLLNGTESRFGRRGRAAPSGR